MIQGTLLCTVRDCRSPLTPGEGVLRCPRGHCFDVARSGYVNLLQPQDKRSKQPGDSAQAVEARRRLHEAGFSAALRDAIGAMLGAGAEDRVLDAGCGEGFYLGSLASRTGFAAHGVDLSVPAIQSAAKRYPQCAWVVANADRFLPYPDGYFTHLMTITARSHGAEFRRVLQAGGRLLVAVPSPEDLMELRGHGKDRTKRVVEDFRERFRLVEQQRATTVADLEQGAVEDVLHTIYRPMRTQPVEAMRVTFSLDLLVFEAV
ncbi:MAG: methyltransferase domain-containing protein [Acidobacteria bacterium]|nr:methyltransferase domain-containing protein [Acidobacteriota bacterium]